MAETAVPLQFLSLSRALGDPALPPVAAKVSGRDPPRNVCHMLWLRDCCSYFHERWG